MDDNGEGETVVIISRPTDVEDVITHPPELPFCLILSVDYYDDCKNRSCDLQSVFASTDKPTEPVDITITQVSELC
ncbi:hypothetical protein Bca52824_060371 [Brassica carinata]|uniref:Uncharacterized protein n=1 Tax=Brassica carinata TaxID=52824 RepID=A0A8X7UHI8_BRACI|nr:hypothetical protein Bca52824_060371 [Brassica carinata]